MLVPCRCLELRGVKSNECYVTFKPKSKHSSRAFFCPACQPIAYATRKKKYRKIAVTLDSQPEKKDIKTTRKHICKCPRCGKTHLVSFFWSGTTTIPRKYCSSCKDSDLNSPDVETYAVLKGVTQRGKW